MKAATANLVVQALTWRMRDLRIRVGTVEIEQAMAVLRSQDEWSVGELEQVLLPIFAKRLEQRPLVSTLIGEFLTPPRQRTELAYPTGKTPFHEGVTPPPPPPPEPWWKRLANKLRPVMSGKWPPDPCDIRDPADRTDFARPFFSSL